jgi:hypothetical protein
MGGMGGGMDMGGMGGGEMMFKYARVNLRHNPRAGMTRTTIGSDGVKKSTTAPKPTLTDWRRALRLHQPISIKW